MSDIDGYWVNANGDKIQLFENDIFISFAETGTIITGPISRTEKNGVKCLGYTNNEGVLKTGIFYNNGTELMFEGGATFRRQAMELEVAGGSYNLSLAQREAEMFSTFFQGGFFAHLEDAFR